MTRLLPFLSHEGGNLSHEGGSGYKESRYIKGKSGIGNPYIPIKGITRAGLPAVARLVMKKDNASA